MHEPGEDEGRERPLTTADLLILTVVTGMVDAVSFLALGHVFTANMTGNIVLMGFAMAHVPGLSVGRSLLAIVSFSAGAVIGGRTSVVQGLRVLETEAALFLAAGFIALGMTTPYEGNSLRLYALVVITALAMGHRNAMVRKLRVPDLTTTVLTLTLTGLASESSLAGGNNPRWQIRCAAILAMLGGAAGSALLLIHSVALPLFTCFAIEAASALAAFIVRRRRDQSANGRHAGEVIGLE